MDRQPERASLGRMKGRREGQDLEKQEGVLGFLQCFLNFSSHDSTWENNIIFALLDKERITRLEANVLERWLPWNHDSHWFLSLPVTQWFSAQGNCAPQNRELAMSGGIWSVTHLQAVGIIGTEREAKDAQHIICRTDRHPRDKEWSVPKC